MLHDETENNKEGKHPNTADHMWLKKNIQAFCCWDFC